MDKSSSWFFIGQPSPNSNSRHRQLSPAPLPAPPTVQLWSHQVRAAHWTPKTLSWGTEAIYQFILKNFKEWVEPRLGREGALSSMARFLGQWKANKQASGRHSSKWFNSSLVEQGWEQGDVKSTFQVNHTHLHFLVCTKSRNMVAVSMAWGCNR